MSSSPLASCKEDYSDEYFIFQKLRVMVTLQHRSRFSSALPINKIKISKRINYLLY